LARPLASSMRGQRWTMKRAASGSDRPAASAGAILVVAMAVSFAFGRLSVRPTTRDSHESMPPPTTGDTQARNSAAIHKMMNNSRTSAGSAASNFFGERMMRSRAVVAGFRWLDVQTHHGLGSKPLALVRQSCSKSGQVMCKVGTCTAPVFDWMRLHLSDHVSQGRAVLATASTGMIRLARYNPSRVADCLVFTALASRTSHASAVGGPWALTAFLFCVFMHSSFLLGSVVSAEQESPHPQSQPDDAKSRVSRVSLGHALLMFECGIALGVAGVVLANRLRKQPNRLRKQQDQTPVKEARAMIGSICSSHDGLGPDTNSIRSTCTQAATIDEQVSYMVKESARVGSTCVGRSPGGSVDRNYHTQLGFGEETCDEIMSGQRQYFRRRSVSNNKQRRKTTQ